jgi:hypothetical protein
MISARGPDSASADELGIDVRAPLPRVARQTPRPLHPVSASFGGGEQPAVGPASNPFRHRYDEAHHPASARWGRSGTGRYTPGKGHERRFPETSVNGRPKRARECLLKVRSADRALARRTSGTGRFQPLGCNDWMATSGTSRKIRSGSHMSAHCGIVLQKSQNAVRLIFR